MVSRSDTGARSARNRIQSWLLLFLVGALTALGLVVLSSAGSSAPNAGGDQYFIFKRQAIWLAPAIIAGVIAATVNLDHLRDFVKWIFGIACVLLVAVRVPGIGRMVNGSWRWLQFGPLRLQVSDIGKIALIIALSHYLANNRRWFSRPRPRLTSWEWRTWLDWKPWSPKRPEEKFLGGVMKLFFAPVWPLRFLRPTGYSLEIAFHRRGFPNRFRIVVTDEAAGDFLHGFIYPCAIIGVICGLIVIEPDLGTTVLCAAVGGILLFVAGVRHLFVWPLVASVSAIFIYIVMNWKNRLDRVLSFLDPEGLREGAGYQLWQGLLGFGVGGADGAGLGQSVQKMSFLPEAHTDFVFAILGEELGLWWTLATVAAFVMIFWTSVSTLRVQQDAFRFNLCFGATLFIVLQALINMGVVTGCLPTKGMALPFISYGGTNLVMMYALTGLILNCVRTGSRVMPDGARELA